MRPETARSARCRTVDRFGYRVLRPGAQHQVVLSFHPKRFSETNSLGAFANLVSNQMLVSVSGLAMTSIEAVERSAAFRKWCAAFRESAGIEVYLVGGDSLASNILRAADATPLCRFLHSHCDRCAGCRKRFAKRLSSTGVNHPGTFAMRCFAGLTVTAIPFKLGDDSTAYLYTSPTYLANRGKADPTADIVHRVCQSNRPPDRQPPAARIRKLAADLPTINRRKFQSSVILLRLLAEHLSHMSRQMLAVPPNGPHDEVAVRRACELIDQRFTENLRLGDVAKAIGVSRSYLSHLFSKQMGLPFTRYLSGRRVIELKRLLADSEFSVTDAMFAAGFQSVSQANRVFHATTGMAPRQFRATARH